MDDRTQTSAAPASPEPAGAGPDLTGRTLGDFVLLRRLGAGGMGQVYLAEQRSLKRHVALKILRPDLAARPDSLRRFKLEAEAVARATHANIVQVYAIGEADGLPYMALEYVEGRNLREYVTRKGPLEAPLALGVLRQAAAALARAGELGIVHRDVKPDNILLTRKGEVKVADFGLSRCLDTAATLHLTQSGVAMGTPLYMSPEQVEGKAVDCRSDLYSLGATAYFMLSGQPPFRGESAFEVALQHVRAQAPPLSGVRPDLPPELCALVHRLLAKDPAARPQTGRELLKELNRLKEALGGSSGALPRPAITAEVLPVAVTGTPPVAPSVPPAAPARWRLLLAVLFALSLAAAAAAGVGLSRLHRAEAPAVATDGPPADPEVEALLAAQTDEKALRRSAEILLASGDGRRGAAAGLEICSRLSFLYLDQGRLDDADEFFRRLEGLTRRPEHAYHVLGRLGRAVVAALRNDAARSNRLFQDLVKELAFDNLFYGPAEKGTEARRGDPDVRALWQNPQMLFWVAQALRYNAENGVKDADVPAALLKIRDLPAARRAESK